MPDYSDIPISSFPDAQSVDASDKVTGLKSGNNTNFSFNSILAWLINQFYAVFLPASSKGAAGGVASLDSTGKIPSDQLPPISSDAADISYDNTGSGLSATDVQDAIDELAQGTGGGTAASVFYDPTSSGASATNVQDALDEAFDDLDGKQDTITASGILKGNGQGGVSAATAGTDYGTYSKPSGGIPSSDMASAVQTSLGKADSAYQKPSGGIPSSDMASGVQTSLGKADTAYQKPSGGIPASDLASGVIPTQPSDIGAQAKITASGILKGNGQGGVSAATAGTDYQAPLTAGTDYATPAQLADKANQAQLAYVETGTTTSRAYSVGEYFCWNGLLYRVMAAISSGGTITPGTNCESTTVAGAIDTRCRMMTVVVSGGQSVDIIINGTNYAPFHSAIISCNGNSTAVIAVYLVNGFGIRDNYRMITKLTTSGGGSVSVTKESGKYIIKNNSAAYNVGVTVSILQEVDGTLSLSTPY